MASFRQAAKLGLRWVELDVYLIKDNNLAVIHDRDLTRTTTSVGDVTDQDAASLGKIDAGTKFSPAFKGEPIPTLTQVLAFCAETGMGINIELKENKGAEVATLDALMACVQPTPLPLLISSFDPAMLRAAFQAMPLVPRGILFESLPTNWHEITASLDCYSVHCDQKNLKSQQVDKILKQGYSLAAYTVNDPEKARELWDRGVQALFTDLPSAMRPLLGQGTN